METQNASLPQPNCFEDYLQRLRRAELLQYLDSLRDPVWECEVMQVAFPEIDLLNDPPLEMYRCHFVLFHVLYSLAPEFYQRGFYLHIHFMRICVQSFPTTSFCQYFDDENTCFCNAPCHAGKQFCDFHWQRIDETAINRLSECYFYLDPENFFAMNVENTEKFMNGAWNLLQNHEDYCRCLAVMGLPDGVTMNLLKKRFRYLAKTMHPDLNAVDHKEFAAINTAYRRLISYLGNG